MFGNVSEAAERAIKSGVDAETPDGEAYLHLNELVKSGRVPQALVDEAVRRMLRLKFEAGLFENPYAGASTAEARTATPDAIALAREAAQRSVVLLEELGRTAPARSLPDRQAARRRHACALDAHRRLQRPASPCRQRSRRFAQRRRQSVHSRFR